MPAFVSIIAILFGLNFWSHLCQGQITLSPPEEKTFVVEPGRNVTIEWTYSATSVFFRSWSFLSGDGGPQQQLANITMNGAPVIKKSIILPGVEIKKPATLVLRNVSLLYNGTYIFNLAAFPTSGVSKLTLFVAGPLNMSVCSSPITVNESTNVACMCKAERDNTPQPPRVAWYDKDGKRIDEGEGMKELNLNNISKTHTGTYTCKVDSYGLKQNKSINVTVNFAPVNTRFTIVTRTGGNVTLKCQAEGLPEPTYEIKFKGTIINTDKSNIIEVGDSNLELYNCTSTNILGSDTVNLTLQAPTTKPPPTTPSPTRSTPTPTTSTTSKTNNTGTSKETVSTTINSTATDTNTSTSASTFPTWAIVVIAIFAVLLLLLIVFLAWRFQKKTSGSERSLTPIKNRIGNIPHDEHVELGGHENPYDSIDTTAKNEGSAPPEAPEAPEAGKKEPVVYATVDKSRKSEPEQGVTYATLDTLAMNSSNGGSTKRDPKPRQETEYADIAEYGKKK